ncbi:hypothetical protein DFH08DRAFT_812659 [Mycena albidolilacea]|uniref:Uncharacterized protein n=1 Tax=Mycena albidolilacea TaxID=1033008 RepID=A0AAD6ZTV7_9AGAR|nr:hypothetical protein DFH08DRAFT_812659 [Mycena albidolilacea]
MRKLDLRLLRNQVNGGVVGLTGKSCKPRKNPITLRDAEKPHAADATFAQALYYPKPIQLVINARLFTPWPLSSAHHPPPSPLRSSLPSAQITLFALTLPLLVAIPQLNYEQVQARKHHACPSSVTAQGTSSSDWSRQSYKFIYRREDDWNGSDDGSQEPSNAWPAQTPRLEARSRPIPELRMILLMATHRGWDLGIAPTASSKASLTALCLKSTSLGVYCHPTTYVALPVPAVPAPRSSNPPNRGARSRRLGSYSHFIRCDPPGHC